MQLIISFSSIIIVVLAFNKVTINHALKEFFAFYGVSYCARKSLPRGPNLEIFENR
jgi:hypothetical protein